MNQRAGIPRRSRRTIAPSLDPLEARQLLNASPLHSHAEPLRHHRAAFVEEARHARHAPARISAAAATPAATSTNFNVVPSPTVDGATLVATAAIADNDIWAVGRGGSGPGTLAEHFNGTRWSVVPTPPLPSGGINGPGGQFFGVAAASSKDVWAVGAKIGPDNPDFGEQLIEHWDGTAWSEVKSPLVEGDSLRAVAAISANDVWAVGDRSEQGFENALIEHWDGTAWSIMPDSSISGVGASTDLLVSVSADASNDVWAVGGETLLHFNGTTWSEVPSPLLHTNAVTALSPTDAWAVGTVTVFADHRQHTKPAIEHWDGTSWSIVSSPNPNRAPTNDTALYGIAAVSADDIWAVGAGNFSTISGTATLIEHWDETSWTIVSSPDPGTASNALAAVTALSDGNVVAVGDQQESGFDATPLILRN
jgi:hypothetical protein